MATFESKKSSDNEIQRFPLRRLEPSIKKFLKVIEIDLDRLHQHQLNVQKFSRLEDWSSLHREQIKASRTVQQIKANIREIEKTRKQVHDDDIQKFDDKTDEVKKRAIRSVMEFLDLGQGSEKSNTGFPERECDQMRLKEKDFLLSKTEHSYSPSLPPSFYLEQTQMNSIPESSQAQESWQNLHENLVELNSMIHEFSTAVQNQQEKIDRIDDNIEHAHENVQQGVLQLSKASKLRAAMFPIAGAVIGGVVGGPIGIVAGAKIGGVAGAVGGALGFAGGTFIKKRQDKVAETELKNLSVPSRSTSLPDLSETSKSGSSWLPWH